MYADDLVVFLSPNPDDFICLREILLLFAAASGLQTNLDKCQIMPIRCSDEEIKAIQQVFPCQLKPFPCTYLGAPLSLSRLRRTDEQRLVDRVAARIPTWKAGMLKSAARATLTRSTLSAIPVHISISCCLSAWGLGEIDKRRRAFLWSGNQSATGGKCKIAWPIVCSPRDYGGLGMPDLRVLGFALRLRWEWRRRTDSSSPWALLPSKPEKIVDAMFKASVRIRLGDSASLFFWTDSRRGVT